MLRTVSVGFGGDLIDWRICRRRREQSPMHLPFTYRVTRQQRPSKRPLRLRSRWWLLWPSTSLSMIFSEYVYTYFPSPSFVELLLTANNRSTACSKPSRKRVWSAQTVQASSQLSASAESGSSPCRALHQETLVLWPSQAP